VSAGIKVTAAAAVIKTKAKDLRYLYRGAVAPADAFDKDFLDQVRDAGLIEDVEIVTPAELEAIDAEREAEAAAAAAEAEEAARKKAAADAKKKADAEAKAKADAAAKANAAAGGAQA